MLTITVDNPIDFIADVFGHAESSPGEAGRIATLPLPDDIWAAIVNTAREVGVSEVSIQRATS